jgi:sugar O-acyltransferase (sialic acid O-acetyltransferase NeuD family)
VKQNLYIIGARGMGRDLYAWFYESNLEQHWEIAGFIDDDRSNERLDAGLPPIISALRGFRPRAGVGLLCGVGDSEFRLRVSRDLELQGAIFPNLIHRSASIARGVSFGKGVLVCPCSIVGSNSHVEDHVILNYHSAIGHDCKVAAGVTLCPGALVNGNVKLGEAVFCGSNSTVLPGVELGSYVTIGAGAVVTKSFSGPGTIIGVPARPKESQSENCKK